MADDVVNPLGAPTTNYGWIKPTVGGDDDVWGGLINTDLDGIDTTVKSVSTVANAAAPLASPALTGNPTAPTQALSDSSTKLSTTAFVRTGVTDGSDAAAGQIGEYITASRASGSPLSLTTATPANLTSIALTAGDWDVRGQVNFTAAASPTVQVLICGASTTTANIGVNYAAHTLPTSNAAAFEIPVIRISSASPATVFLVAQANFTAGTVTAYGIIAARRVR